MSAKRPIYLVAQLPEGGPEGWTIPPPFGIMYVAQSLIDAGYRVRIINLAHNRLKTIQEVVNQEKPLFVGFSNYLVNELKFDIEISKWLHQEGIKVVWGGIFATTLPEATLESGYVDYVVIGEGEIPSVSLAQAIENGVAPAGIPGVAYVENGEIVVNPPGPVEKNLDKFGLAWDLIDLNQFMNVQKDQNAVVFALPFSRGCPYNCPFCYNAMDPTRKVWRGHSPDYLKDIHTYLNKRMGVNAYSIICDNTFGNVSKAKDMITGLESRWMAPTHLGVINAEFLDWALETRCANLSFGLESGSDRVLKLLNKNFTSQDIREKLALCREKGVHTTSSWIILAPGETVEDFRLTIELLDEIHRAEPTHGLGVNICRAYPKTPFWEVRKQHGLPEPGHLDEWPYFMTEIHQIAGYTDTKMRRMQTLSKLLFPKFRIPNDKRVPRWARPLLKRRLMKTSFNFPIEETLKFAWRTLRKINAMKS